MMKAVLIFIAMIAVAGLVIWAAWTFPDVVASVVGLAVVSLILWGMWGSAKDWANGDY